MTIDSGWVRVMKEEAPDAFQASYPFEGAAKVAYIDGMPLLMTCERNVKSWDDLLRFNYARHIMRYFRLGCEAVVLAFDDYERVPMAKAITQANRVKKRAPYEFGEAQQLPPTMPAQYNEKLSNRIFKRRVIDMVCNRVLEHMFVSASERYTRKFVVDYTGCPILFEAAQGQTSFDCRKPTFLTELPPMGEADIKYLRWAEHFKGDMIAYSVDGDFIPIALMSYEARMHKLREEHRRIQQQQPSVDASRLLSPVYNIAIYRIKYKAHATSAASATATTAATAKQAALMKGQLTLMAAGDKSKGARNKNRLVLSGSAAAMPETSADSGKATTHAPREFEYVNVPKLYLALRSVFASFSPASKRQPLHQYHYMRMFAVLIGLGGTDFSRGLPFIGPGTLWGMLSSDQSVFSALLQSYDPARGMTDADDACSLFACSIYMCKFATHFKKVAIAAPLLLTRTPLSSSSRKGNDSDGGEDDGFEAVRDVLLSSQLSEKTRADLPSSARVNATFRNINWLLHYWTCTPPRNIGNDGDGDDDAQKPKTSSSSLWDYSVCYPDPVCAEYGFKYRKDASNSRRGKKKAGKKRARSSSSCTSSSSSSKKRATAGAAIQWLDEDDASDGDDGESGSDA